MTSQSTVFVDPSDMSGKIRTWQEVPHDEVENLGDEPVWWEGTKFYKMPDNWRSRYMKVPVELELTISELATWYSVVPNKNEDIHFQDTETRLPENILLTDGSTLLVKNKKQKIMIPGVIGTNDYNMKFLFNKWRKEEDIEKTSKVTKETVLFVFPKIIL